MANTKITPHVLDGTLISGHSTVTAATNDFVLIQDVSDSNALKKALVSDLAQNEESPTFTGNVVVDGTLTAGSVNASGGFLNGANGGIRIHSGGTKFFNVTAANAARDNIMDIGASDARFKDLHIGGAAYIDGGAIFNEDSADVDFRVESNDSANMLSVNGGDNTVSINANNTDSVTNSATALAARTLIINGNEGEGSDNLSVFAMADGTGNYGMEVSNSAHTAQYDLLINPIMGGNVGIGTTSANTLLHAAKGGNGSGLIDIARFQNKGTTVNDGARIQLTAGASTSGAGIGCLGDALNSAHLVFHAGGNTERMRIASSGHLLVGRTTTSVGGQGHRIDPNGESFLFADTASALSTLHVYDSQDSAYRFYVDAAGSNAGRINATNTTIQGISDIRLKENVRDLEMGMNDLMKLKPRTFDWKEGEGAQKANASGFIAQEAEAAGFEEFIGDYKHEKITDAKSFGQGGLIPLLVKCIQELETRVKELEG